MFTHALISSELDYYMFYMGLEASTGPECNHMGSNALICFQVALVAIYFWVSFKVLVTYKTLYDIVPGHTLSVTHSICPANSILQSRCAEFLQLNKILYQDPEGTPPL